MDWKVLVGSKILVLILLSTSVKSDDGEKRVVCYYTNWSVYRPGTAKFSPQNINPYLCTHLIYAFGGFTKDNTLKPFDKYQDIDKGGYAKFTGLKTYNKDLKTLLAIGGWNEASSRFSPMVADPQKRRKFVKNVVKFLRQNHFDGLDLDWEYPAFREGGKPRDRENYASFVQELREEFEKESSKTGRPRLLLTMAVPAGIEYIDKGYDIPKLDEYLDFINLLSYDYHSAYEPAVNHHAPLYPLEEDNEYNYDNELTIDYTINHLIKNGATPGKIVVGIPTYGRSYTLFNEDAAALGSPADGPGTEGDATREKGYLAYYEICKNVQKDDWIVEKPNPKAMGPYAYKENQWVGYDDEDIVREKAKYVNQKKLGGIMFWSIDNDDFRGECHGRPYPLIEAAKEALLEENEKQKADERPNAISTKTRNRVSSSKSDSQSNNRKSNSNSSRRNTISRSVTTKRPSSKVRSRSNSKTRIEYKAEDEPNDEDAENSENVETTKTPSKSTRSQVTNKNRFRTRQNTNDHDSRKKQVSRSATTQKSRNSKITTPEPPTTPDPGGDFKCEDEGFFPHPRDCKKYFWCLDSGPSGLGIVANQFTCPSGLVFNKLADSCDYPRNVVCPKARSKDTPSTTTQRTTTEKDEVIEDDDEEDEDYVDEEDDVKEVEEKIEEKPKKSTTTTARPLLYKTISRSRPTTTTTTTSTTPTPFSTAASPRLADDISEEEQDPKVIKELIDLIKKAGGIEQLEKQLALQEKGGSVGGSAQGSGQVTPATISKSLYDRVLNRQSGKNNLFKIPTSRLSTTRKTDIVKDTNEDDEQDEKVESDKLRSKIKFVNGPGRSQFEGLDEVPEVKSLRRSNKPKYVTIERHSSSTASSKLDEEVIEDESDDEEEEDNEEIASSEEKLISNVPEETNLPTQRSTPGYVNIRRTRPTTTTEISRNDNDIKEEDTIVDDQPTPNLRQHTFGSTEQTQKATQEHTTPKSRYISINRFRSTTVTPEKEIKQTTIESTTAKPVTTSQIFEKEIENDEKTITIAGESGRISIPSFTTETPSTARLFSDLLSTVTPTTPYIDEDFDSTHHTTKRVLEANATPNPNIIEDSVTESLLTIAPTESSTKETIAAVSQPRPFGFPRRTRPTSAAPTITDTTRSSLPGTESTSRTKVSDELISHNPDYKEITTHKSISHFITEHPKKISISNNSLYSSKPENDQDYSFIKKSLLINPANQNDTNGFIKVPVKFVGDPKNEFFLLQIPENKINISGISSILKIQVLKSSEINVKNVNISNYDNTNTSVLNEGVLSTTPSSISTDIATTILETKISQKYVHSSSISTTNTPIDKTEKTIDIGNSADATVKHIGLNNNDGFLKNLAENSMIDTIRNADGKLDIKNIEGAIYNLLNSTVKPRQTFFNPHFSQNNQNSTRKVHRQRVLIYRGATKDQQPNNSTQKRWVMKKVIRKRIRRTKSKLTEDLETSDTAPEANVLDSFTEVNTPRQPGLSFFRRPGDAPLSRGVYTISSATLSPTKKIYPVQIGIENTRVVGIMADQSGNPQNLELILADPPASLSSTTDSGKPAVTRPNFRRKISTTISPQTTEESQLSTSSSRIISSEKRRQGQKYGSERIVPQNSYHIRSRPYKHFTDYDYYEDEEERFVIGKTEGKLLITSRGFIKCLDQGNFPHPNSCKKFITCAKMVNGNVVGTEYTCPDKLSFDPIGGICNWSAGLGCNE